MNWEFRKALVAKYIEILKNTDDPRRDDAVAHYEAQLAEINRHIEIDNSPHDVVIGLKPGILNATTGE